MNWLSFIVPNACLAPNYLYVISSKSHTYFMVLNRHSHVTLDLHPDSFQALASSDIAAGEVSAPLATSRRRRS
jgi:hypothetical protein